MHRDMDKNKPGAIECKLCTETWIKINLEPLNEVKHRDMDKNNLEPLNEVKHRDMDKNKPGAIECKLCTEDMDKNKPGAIECKLCTETWIKINLEPLNVSYAQRHG